MSMLFITGNLIVAQAIRGIDVSHYQGTIDWKKVHDGAGIVFAFAKATEGITNSLNDDFFTKNMINGINAGVVMGAYHIARPTINSAEDEANHFLSVAACFIGPGQLPPVLDLEPDYIDPLTKSALSAWILIWVTTVQNATGIAPIIYTTSFYAANRINITLNSYKLWIATYPSNPIIPPSNLGVWSNWTFNQYSADIAMISGIITPVDLDVFNGSINDLNNLIGVHPNPHSFDLKWANSIGGINNDEAKSILIDKNGDYYLAGKFSGSVDFDPGPGNTILNSNGSIFIAKYANNGDFIWVKQLETNYIGGFGWPHGYPGKVCMAIDNNSNLLITGVYSGATDFDPGPEKFKLTASTDNAFILKLDPGGNFIWVKVFNSIGSNEIKSLAIDSDNNVYTVGTFRQKTDLDPGLGTFDTNVGSSMFIDKLNESGNFVWAKAYNLGFPEFDYSIKIDLSNNPIISGSFTNKFSCFNCGLEGTLVSLGFYDIFVAKYNSAGTILWAKSFPSNENIQNTAFNYDNSIEIDKSGNVYIIGNYFTPTDFDPGPGQYYLDPFDLFNLFFNTFLVKLDPLGKFVCAKRVLSGSGGYINDIKIKNDFLYITGVYNSNTPMNTVDFDPGPNKYYLNSELDYCFECDNYDVYITKLDLNGNFVDAQNFGSKTRDISSELAIDEKNNLFITGAYSSSISNHINGSKLELSSKGLYDTYVLKFGQDLNAIPKVNSLICTNVIKGHQGIQENKTIYEDHTPNANNEPIKICADGSTATYFKINVASDPQNFSFQILKKNGNIANSTDADTIGLLGTAYLINNGNDVEISYTAPKYMEGEGIHRTLTLQVTYKGIAINNINFPLHIYRAPVMFVHGIWGDKMSFPKESAVSFGGVIGSYFPTGGIIKYLTTSEKLYPYYPKILSDIEERAPLFWFVDYSNVNDASGKFNEYQNVIYGDMSVFLNKLRLNKFSCSKIDLMCHSMGGIVARLFLQDPRYKNNNNIHKFITLDSPHNGTQSSNFLLSPVGKTVKDYFNDHDMPCDNGAVEDLSANSCAMQLLNAAGQLQYFKERKVPTNVIICKETPKDCESLATCGFSEHFIVAKSTKAYNKYYKTNLSKVEFVLKMFDNDNSDLVVPIKSQKNGLSKSSEFENLTHTDIRVSPSDEALKHLKKLLNANNNDATLFSIDGFSPSKLNSVFGEECNLRGLPPSIENNLLYKLEIVVLNQGDIQSDDTLKIKVIGSLNLDEIELTCGSSKYPIFYNNSTNLDTAIFNIPLSGLVDGSVIIMAQGFDSTAYVIEKHIFINVLPTSTLELIKADKDTFLIDHENGGKVYVMGFYNDSTSRNLYTRNGLVFCISDPSIIDIDSNLIITPLKVGSTDVIFKYKDKKDTINVNVLNISDIHPSTFLTENYSICSNSIISFKNLTNGNPISFYWSFPGGFPSTSTLKDPIIKYSASGNYKVSLITSFSTGSDTLIVDSLITVNLKPIVNFNQPNVNAPTISGPCTAILDAGNPGSTYLWSTGETTQYITVNISGSYIVTVTNENGCSSIGDVFANIADKVKPVVKTKNITVYLNDNNSKVTITPEMIDNGSSDNCGMKSIVVNPNMFECKNVGSNTVYLTVTDNNGNTSSASALVNVIDSQFPRITCPADKQGITKPGACSIPSSSTPLGSPTGLIDNCGIKYPVTNNAPANYSVGITNVIWTVSDVNGNKSTCIQQVTVLPFTCGKPSQVLVSEITKSSAKIKWIAGTCGTQHQLNIRQEIITGIYGAWSAWISASGPGLQHVFTNLVSNKNYQFQLRGLCGTVYSGNVIGTFKTKQNLKDDESQNRSADGKDRADNSNESIAKIEIIPNPARDYTTLLIQGFEKQSKEVTMLDFSGKLVFNITVNATDNQLELDLNKLSVHSGIYLIRVSDNQKQKTEQLMIER